MNLLSKALKATCRACLNFAFPSLCCYCKEIFIDGQSLFCRSCSELVELIAPEERCSFCFSEEPSRAGKPCKYCLSQSKLFNGIATAVDYEGPVRDVVWRLKYGGQAFLAKSIAACMYLQWQRLNWPAPQLVIPVPMPLSRLIFRGYNQSELIAKEFAEYFNVPVLRALKRLSFGYSQAALTRDQRLDLSRTQFLLRKQDQVEDKVVFIVDDVMTTGATLGCCGEALAELYPLQMYGLSFARAI